MTWRYRVLPEFKLGVFMARGEVSAYEAVEVIQTMTDDPAWQAGCSILWDARWITSLDIDLVGAAELRKVGRNFLVRIRIIRSAAVLRRELDVQMASFLSKAIALKSTKRQVEFFETLVKACEWLDVPVSVVDLWKDTNA
jgi:hypothetical protein